MKLLALDLSTTCTGWAVGESESLRPKTYGHIKPKAQLFRPSRIEQTVAEVMNIARMESVEKVVAEDINAGQGGTSSFQTALALAELRGALQLDLWRWRGLTLELANLSTIKSKLAVARQLQMKGTPKKEHVRQLLRRLNYHPENDDESDAIAVWLYARGWMC